MTNENNDHEVLITRIALLEQCIEELTTIIKGGNSKRFNIPKEKKMNNNIKNNTEKISLGQRSAEGIAKVVGSWKFIIIQSVIILIWIILNTIAVINHWDHYPFVLMNLMLSLQAAFTAPMILMAQNRQSEIDRLILHKDFKVDTDTNRVVQSVHTHLEWQDDKIEALLEHLNVDLPPKPRPVFKLNDSDE